MRTALILVVLAAVGLVAYFTLSDRNTTKREAERSEAPPAKETPDPKKGNPHGHGSDVAKAHGIPTGPVVMDVTVVDGDSQPVAGAMVEAFTRGVLRFRDPVAQIKTGANGVARLEFPAGNYWVGASHGDAGAFPAAMVGIPAGTRTSRTMMLRPARTLRGSVVTSEGAPVPGALLEIGFNPGRGSNRMKGKADDQGGFELPGIPTKWLDRVDFFVDTPDSSYPRCRFSFQAPKGPVSLTLTSVTVRARVVDEAGQPIASAYVKQLKPDRLPRPVAVTDKDGRFETSLQHIAGGLLLIEARGFAPRAWTVEALDIPEIKLARGVSLRGKVTDPAGNPIPLVWVYLKRPELPGEILHATPTGPDGAFRFRAIADAPHSLQAFRPDSLDLARPTLDVDNVRGDGSSLALVLPEPLITKVQLVAPGTTDPVGVHAIEVVVRDRTTGAAVVRRVWPPRLLFTEIRVAVWKEGLYELELKSPKHETAKVEFRARAESINVPLKEKG